MEILMDSAVKGFGIMFVFTGIFCFVWYTSNKFYKSIQRRMEL